MYFGNSGTEAVEAALKFARYATGRSRILYCDHAFHGLTAGSLSANGDDSFRKGFGPLLPDTVIPFGDLAALERELKRGDVAGLLVEPIQGKGVAIAPPGFLVGAHALLKQHKALLIADEVGDQLQAGLQDLVDKYEMLKEVRGRGLMIGIEFGRPSSLKLRASWMALQAARTGLFAQTIVHALFHQHHILTQVSGDHLEVIKLIPPLTIGPADADRFVAAFADVMDQAHHGGGLVWEFGKTLIKQARTR